MSNEQSLNWTQTASISKTYERAKAEHLGISRRFIHEACLNGQLKHSRIGNKSILVYWPNLLELLQNGTVSQPVADNTFNTIKPIPEKLPKVRAFRRTI